MNRESIGVALLIAMVLAFGLSLTGCAASSPNLIDELQNQAQIHNIDVPTQLTDLGIVRYGEKVLSAWGTRSIHADVWGTTGAIGVASLSTAALAASGTGGVHPNTAKGLVAGGNWLLQVMGILKPAERNDARHEGAAMILDARGAFLEALAEKRIYHISNTRYTPQGALYFRQIGSAIKVVDKLIVGLAPRIADLEALKPVPPAQQPDPGPEPAPPTKATIP